MKRFVEKHRGIMLELIANLFVVCFVLLILHHFSNVIVSIWIDVSLLTIITFASVFTWFFIFFQKDKEYFKSKIEPYLRNLFLTGLLVILTGNLASYFVEDFPLLSSFASFFSSIQFYLSLITIGFAFLTFYFNMELIEVSTRLEKKV